MDWRLSVKLGDYVIETGYDFGNSSGIIVDSKKVKDGIDDVLILYDGGGLDWTDHDHLVLFDPDLANLMGIGL